MARCPRIFGGVARKCRHCCKVVRGLYKESPIVFAVVIVVVLVIILLVTAFTSVVKSFVGARGTVLVNLTLFWLFARLVARILMFPGSLKLFQRNTEATFRTEMARQYVHYLRQLWTFLRHASQHSESMLRGVTADGIVKGCAVVETLSASFKMQQANDVKLSGEQETMCGAAEEIERWLAGARVKGAGVGRAPPQAGQSVALVPLMDWLRQHAAGVVPSGMSPFHALMNVELAGEREHVARSIEKVEQLLGVLDDLRHPKKGMFSNAMRFCQTPAIGSLHQLRTELQMRYSGHQCWVPTRGRHKLDAMFIPSDGGPGTTEDEGGREDAPLKSSAPKSPTFAGPTLIWCNPNAAYYETMVYQATWLKFWLDRGVNLLVFNYAGYGRSTGKPSPSRIAEDGESVIKFLKSKGITQIGVYGRSIGGVAACHIARKNADVVHLCVADRTMSTMAGAAKYLYGDWAAKGLKVTSMTADNVDNFWEVRCYKLLVCDPKDTMILDLASLRTAVALRVLGNLAPEERLVMDDDKLKRLGEVWHFLILLFTICESDDDAGFDSTLGTGRAEMSSHRPARQPNFAREEPRTPAKETGAQTLNSMTGSTVNAQWLEDNPGLVRTTMAPLIDQVRSALDVVGEYLEGGGVTLNDVFMDNPGNATWALRCMLANLQVWGTLGDLHEEAAEFDDQNLGALPSHGQQLYGAAVDEREIEHFLRKDGDCEFSSPRQPSAQRLAELAQVLAPEMLSTFHRRLARARVAQVRRDFRRRLGALQHTCGNLPMGGDAQGGEQADRLLRTVLHNLCEVEAFLSSLGRFFKSVDLALPYNRHQNHKISGGEGVQDQTPLSDSSDEKLLEAGGERQDGLSLKHSAAAPQPGIDHAAAGYIMHIDCGHNGVLDEVDMRQLSLHLRAARFGRSPGEVS